jgi:ligand-binding sensor domain-containing protein/signal transduction histidine kinase
VKPVISFDPIRDGKRSRLDPDRLVVSLGMLTRPRLCRATVRLLILLSGAADSVLAVDPNQPAASYIRTSFTVEDGLSSNVVNAIVQTRNGFLWIGTDAGLDRFNGRHFAPIYFRGPRTTPQGIVSALAEGPDGDLWVGTNNGLVRIASAALDHFDRSLSTFYHPGAGVNEEITCLRFSRDGALWVGTNGGLYRFGGRQFESVMPGVFTSRIEESADGHLLVVTGGRFVELDGTRIIEHPGLPNQLGILPKGLFHVFQDHKGVLWFSTGAGLARSVNGSIERFQPYGVSGVHGMFQVYEDRQANVWAWSSTAIFRVSATRLEPLGPNIATRTAYSDRENNLWVGTNGEGLMRFKDRPIRMFTKADGLPNNISMTVLSRRDGSLWVGNNCGGLSVFDGERFKTYDEKDGLSNSCVWSLAEGENGELWVGTWGGGLFHFADGRFVQISKAQGLADDVVRAISAARDGSLWIATENGGLSHLRNGHLRNYTVADGLSSNRVVTVYQDRSGGIWAGTSRGINRMTGDRFGPVSSAREILEPRYISLGEDSSGNLYALSAPRGIDRVQGNQLVAVNHDLDLLSMAPFGRQNVWFSGGNGIFRVSAAALGRTERDHDAPLDYASFGRADGMASPQCSIGAPNMALAAGGKLWVATVQGLAMIELQRLPGDAPKPLIYVEEVTVGRTKQPAGRELVLPPGTHHVELHFDSISLAWAEKIRFQYRMDDVDPVWLDADNLRTAVYTRIPVGRHAFHIRACNSNGVWDRSGVAFAVTQKPYFYEAGWFRLAGATAFLLIFAGGYRLRLQQIRAQIHARLDERVSERTRVARELHDTLLQTIQASKMVAGIALEDPSDAAGMHRALERLSLWLTKAMEEGRAALSSLRTSTTQGNDLAEALQRAWDECGRQSAMTIALTVEGNSCDVHAIIRDDVYHIGYEAIRNACTHSGGSRLDVELSYVRDLILRVRDNGRGIDPKVLAKGKDGHFGIKGIQERAQRVGARLSLHSSSAGTEVELIVPGRVAFRQQPRVLTGSLKKLRRFFHLTQ